MFGNIIKDKNILKIIFVVVLFVAFLISKLLGYDQIISLFPIAIALTAAIILISWNINPKLKIIYAFSIIFAIYIFQLVQVNVGLLGNVLTYTDVLGIKALNVPLVVPLISLIAILSSWQIVSMGKLSNIYKFVVAGFIVMMQNIVFESFGSGYGLWHWTGAKAPLLSYILLLVVSEIFFVLFYRFIKNPDKDIFTACSLPIVLIFIWLMLVLL